MEMFGWKVERKVEKGVYKRGMYWSVMFRLPSGGWMGCESPRSLLRAIKGALRFHKNWGKRNEQS